MLVANNHGPRTKISANWVGPRRVCQILSNFTVELEHLIDSSKDIVHVCRIKPYIDAQNGTSVEMKEIAEFSDQIFFSVDKVKDLREKAGQFQVLVGWKGYSSNSDTWEPLNIMYEDAPGKVREYFKRHRSNAIIRRAKASLPAIAGSCIAPTGPLAPRAGNTPIG